MDSSSLWGCQAGLATCWTSGRRRERKEVIFWTRRGREEITSVEGSLCEGGWRGARREDREWVQRKKTREKRLNLEGRRCKNSPIKWLIGTLK